MLKRFLPGQDGFFKLFQSTADIVVDATEQFHALLQHLDDQQQYVNAIAAQEEKGDQLAHATFELLHKTFVTPFDRHDIHQLTSGLDDILDLLNRCAQRFPFYQLRQVPEEVIQLANIALQSSQLLKQAVYQLHSLQKSDQIFDLCEKINSLESEAHLIVLAGEKKLFASEIEFKHFYKLKAIYEKIKLVIDSCQDVSNTIKGIILEYS